MKGPTLMIAIVAPSYKAAEKCMEELIVKDDLKYLTRSERVSKNGIVCRNVTNMNPHALFGSHIDQLIIVDDDLGLIYDSQKEIISKAIDIINMSSCVPDLFQIQYYEME